MNPKFTHFTPMAMRAFRQEIDKNTHRRVEFVDATQRRMTEMLARFRMSQDETEARRQEAAHQQAAARQSFRSALKSRVHSLLGCYGKSRQELAADLQRMNHAVRAARASFQGR